MKVNKADTKKAPAVKSAKATSARLLYGGWNRKKTALLTYDLNGEWKSKVAATKAPELIKSGELAPISSVYEGRKAADLADIKARAAELTTAKASKKQASADANQLTDANRKQKEKARLERLAQAKAIKKGAKFEASNGDIKLEGEIDRIINVPTAKKSRN